MLGTVPEGLVRIKRDWRNEQRLDVFGYSISHSAHDELDGDCRTIFADRWHGNGDLALMPG
jgi:hypothetical protein